MLSSVKIEYTDHGDPRDPRMHPRREDAMDARILTVAETGFSMLDIYSGHRDRPFAHMESQEALQAFADKINVSGQADYLPNQRVAAVPRRFFRDLADSTDPEHLEQFKAVIKDFFLRHVDEFAAKNLFVDYRVSPDPVPMKYVEATIEVLNSLPEYACVRRVMFFTKLREWMLPADFDSRAEFERVTHGIWPRNW